MAQKQPPSLSFKTKQGILCKVCGADFTKPSQQELNYAWQACAKTKCGLMHVDEKEYDVDPNQKIIYYANSKKEPAWIYDKEKNGYKVFVEPPRVEHCE